MIIKSYAIQASASRDYLKVESSITTSGRTKASGLAPPPTVEAPKPQAQEKPEPPQPPDSQPQKPAQLKLPSFKTYQPAPLRMSPWVAQSPQDLRLKLLAAMIYALTGKRIDVKPLEQLQGTLRTDQRGMAGIAEPQMEWSRLGVNPYLSGTQRAEPMVNFAQTEHFQYERESLHYQARGIINTADGQSIHVDVNMQMSRQFVSYTSTSIVWQQPTDPLVVNYAGTAASLTQQTYRFDLTMDGREEQIHFAGPGSGFLAVDWNGDGQINDGSELFGPQSGDGFAELKKYDQDGNGWIDEADDLFAKLVVWSKDENGNDLLFTLQDLGIGAIYLGDINTQFFLTDSQNNTQGLMRSTSFFLKENGGAGTISHVDLLL